MRAGSFCCCCNPLLLGTLEYSYEVQGSAALGCWARGDVGSYNVRYKSGPGRGQGNWQGPCPCRSPCPTARASFLRAALRPAALWNLLRS